MFHGGQIFLKDIYVEHVGYTGDSYHLFEGSTGLIYFCRLPLTQPHNESDCYDEFI